MTTIQLQLELAEVNKILKTLGTLAYADVYQLIEKIQMQASQQIDVDGQPGLTEPSDPADVAE